MPSAHSFVLVVVGLALEARIAARQEGADVYCRRNSDGDGPMQQALEDPHCRGAISFGIAGGLDHKLAAGTHLVASEILTPHGVVPTDLRWSKRLIGSSGCSLHVPILGVDRVILSPGEKRDLFERTGAVAVDTESHIIAQLARNRGLPFACLRVVADPAHRRIPEVALSGLHPDGRTYPLGAVRALIQRPRQAAELLLLARDAWLARRSMLRAMALIGGDFGLPADDSATAANVIEIMGEQLFANAP